MLDTLRQLRALLTSNERRQWLGLLPLAALAVLLEAAGAAALITSIGRALGTPGTAGQTAFLAILLSGVFVLRGAVVASVVKRRERAIAETISGLTTRMLDGYLRAPYESMISRHSSLTAQRVTQTVEQVVTLSLVGSFTVAIELFVAVAVVIVLLIATPLAALSAVAATAALVAGGLMLVRPRFSAWSTQQLGLHQQSMKELHEGFGALAEIKVLGTEPFFHQRITNDRRTLANIQAHRRTLSERLRIAIETTVLAAMLLSVIVVVLDGMSAANAVSVLGLYAYAGLRLVPSANRIAASIGLVRSGRAYLSDLSAEWQWLSLLPQPSEEVAFPLRLDSTIRVESVGFEYPESARLALRDVEMTIRRGEAVGIVGPIGAGKSTLIKLLLGLLRPTHGRILIDGVDLHTRLASWQRAVGYVPQKPFLLSDTIRRNIAFGQPDVAIDENAVRWAIRTAGLDPVIDRLRDGIDTVLKESGAGLSGGEQQLLAVARALYRRPTILVLDEPAAALDPVARAEIAVVLAALKGSVTIVAVSHRPEDLPWCDHIYEIRAGQLIGSS